jgi:hypothetical protein
VLGRQGQFSCLLRLGAVHLLGTFGLDMLDQPFHVHSTEARPDQDPLSVSRRPTTKRIATSPRASQASHPMFSACSPTESLHGNWSGVRGTMRGSEISLRRFPVTA